jgi:nickel-dependent lactate racemase
VQVSLDYGRGRLELDLPAGHPLDVLEKKEVPALADPEAALRAAVAAPLGAPPLRELARGRRDAVVVVSDRTRPVPNALLLPPLLEALAEAGLPPEAVTVLVATGLHRPATREELDEILGPRLARTLRVEQHDARDRESHLDLGSSRGGIPILLDRRYLDAELKILTGLVEPHLMAGYSGGRKALCPGLAALETIRVAHGPRMLEGAVGAGIVAGNPLHEDLLEIAARAGVDFIANVALDRARRVSGVWCGDVREAHAAAMAFVEDECRADVAEPADLVIASGGGDPLDATFYQSIKGVAAAAGIVRPGGAILLCASLSEGIGSPSFEKLLRESPDPAAFERRLEDDAFFAVDQWMVQHLCQARRRARVLLYTDGLPLEAAGELLVEAVATPEEGVARALAGARPGARIAVLPQGPYVLATAGGRLRPLGAASGAGRGS